MRQEANTKGYMLNEYNLEELTEEKKVVDPNGEEIKTEKDNLWFLKMGYVEPWHFKGLNKSTIKYYFIALYFPLLLLF